MYGEEKIFWTGPTRAAKAEQKYLVPARQAQRITTEYCTYIGRDETGSVYLPTQLERTLQLYW